MKTSIYLKKHLPVILITLLFSTGFNFLMIEIFKTEYKDETLKLSEWGDYVGGIYGTLISFFGLIATIIASVFVYQTLKTQKTQLKIQETGEYFNRISGLILRKNETITNSLLAMRNLDNLPFDGDYEWMKRSSYHLENFIRFPSPPYENISMEHLKSRDGRARITDAFELYSKLLKSDKFPLLLNDKILLSQIISSDLNLIAVKELLKASNKYLEFMNTFEVQITHSYPFGYKLKPEQIDSNKDIITKQEKAIIAIEEIIELCI